MIAFALGVAVGLAAGCNKDKTRALIAAAVAAFRKLFPVTPAG